MPELGVSEVYIAAAKAAQLETLRKHRALYTPMRPPIDPAGRIVIVVDNGIATHPQRSPLACTVWRL